MKTLDGQPITQTQFLYDITETCPWCEVEIGARAVINNAPRIYTEETWMAEPRGVEIKLFFLGQQLAQHRHICEQPWLP